jgi:hypothetical protein
MSKTVTVEINNFSGGVSDDPRENDASKFQATKHFDIFSNPKKLTPYRSLETDNETSVSTTDLKQYTVNDYVYSSTSTVLYGLGKVVATGFTKIVQKANAVSGIWTLPASSEGNGAVRNGCLIEYKDYLWGFQGTTQIFRWGLLSGTPAIANSQSSVGTAITSVAQGIVFNDYLYLPYNNKIWRATDAATYSDAYLTLPTNFKITSLTTYGSYIAIACAPISTYNGASKVFLWDGTSTDVQEKIDWGEGELRVLETIEGQLVGVTDRYLNNATGAGRGSMVIQTYSGGSPTIVFEVFTQALTGKSIPLSKAVKNNRLFFACKIMTNSAGTTYNEGLWSYGRKNVKYPFACTLDVIDENINTNGIQAFGTAANYFFITHSNDGSIDKTDDTAAYTFSSVYESQILNFGDIYNDKTLLSLEVSFPAIVAGTLTAKYRVDGATSWTTIGTYSTAGATSYQWLNIASTGDSFASGNEYEFQLTSTGGLEITGIRAKAIINDTP